MEISGTIQTLLAITTVVLGGMVMIIISVACVVYILHILVHHEINSKR